MKTIAVFPIILLFILATTFSGCKKDCSGTEAEIIKSPVLCYDYAILINGTSYPVDNLPEEFKVDQLAVCISDSMYEDMRLCPCCGGTWVYLKSISKR